MKEEVLHVKKKMMIGYSFVGPPHWILDWQDICPIATPLSLLLLFFHKIEVRLEQPRSSL